MIDIKNLNNPVTFKEVADSVNANFRPGDDDVMRLVDIANGKAITMREFAGIINRYQPDDDLIRRIAREQGWLDRMGMTRRQEICDDGVDIIDEGNDGWRCRKMVKDDILYAVTKREHISRIDRNHIDGTWWQFGIERIVFSHTPLENAKADLTSIVSSSGAYFRKGSVYVTDEGKVFSPGQMYADIPGIGIYAIKEM